jgi:HD-GYP domain-containing protein (c-di-GMP phosphodiesterase class II)
MNFCEDIFVSLQKEKLNDDDVGMVSKGLDQVQELMGIIPQEKKEWIRSFLASASAYEHAVGVVMLSYLIAKQLKIESRQGLQAVGFSAFFHDIGLNGMPLKLQSEDISSFTPDERKFYEYHPLVGAEFLRSIEGIDPVVVQAVEQHHERHNNQGFPKKLRGDQINKLAEVVGVADVYSNFLKTKKALKQSVGAHEIHEFIVAESAGFSLDVMEALTKVLL